MNSYSLKKIVSGMLILVFLSTVISGSVFADNGASDSLALDSSTYEFQLSERSMNLNSDWKFYLGNASGGQNINYDDSSWQNVDLPHDWSIEQDFTNEVRGEIGHLPGGVGWYRKSLVLPKDYADKHITLDFGGVYMDSNTYVNGEFIGNYPNGYMPFSYNISNKLICDGVTENIIAVQATCMTSWNETSSRWYSGSGIYRDVLLTVTDEIYVPQYGTVITTPDIESEYGSGAVTVSVKNSVNNDSDKQVDVKVRNSIINYYDDNIVSSPVETEVVSVGIGSSYDFTQSLIANSPLLWSDSDPNLYRVRTEVIVDGKVVDTSDARFGFRWFNFDKDTGFSLNGNYMKMHGVCMHHDQGALGAVANEAAIARQIRILKEMGSNSIRVTHNPAADNLLQLCDEQGMLVIEEAFDTWYTSKKPYDYGRYFEKACTHPDAESGTIWAKYDLQNMIRRGINFPSIIMWSLGNEIGVSDSAKGLETVKNLIKWTKEIDTTRPTTMGEDKFRWTNPSGTETRYFIQVASQLDVVGINYGVDNYDGYRAKYPDWIIYGAETSSAVNSRGYYSDPGLITGAQQVVEYQLSSYDNSPIGHGDTATKTWLLDRDRQWIGGQFIWTGFDYIGEPSPFSHEASGIPKSSYFGIIDTAGFPKDDFYLYQSQWLDVDTDPMVHIFPHWNWEDTMLRDKVTINGKIPVRIYSNAPKVELFMDGESLGEKSFAQMTTYFGKNYQQQSQTSDRLYLEWLLEYEHKPGTTIVAQAKDNEGNIIATDTIATASDPAALKMSADRQVIRADGNDLSYITIDVTDASGNFMPNAMNNIRFQISGDGKIVGVDNGNAASWERFKDTNGVWQRKAFNGKALVIVQSTKEAGSFTLKAIGAGLGSDEITVYTGADDSAPNTILGYDIPKITTNTNVMPSLPETVVAVMADGRRVEKQVTWTMPSANDIAQPNELTLEGLVETNDTVFLNLTVRGLVGLLEKTLVTMVGIVPKLPDEVSAIWSDGMSELHQVTWDTVTSEDFGEVGIVTINGSVDGISFPAIARVRVTDELIDLNIASTRSGTIATASYQEGVDQHPAREANDESYNNDNGWGNWQRGGRLTDDLVLIFAQPYTLSKSTVWFTNLNTWQVPDSMIIEYWDGSAFLPVTNQSKTTGFTGRNSQSGEYSGELVAFDEIVTDKLRFNFKLNAYATGKDMMKITEIEVWDKGYAPYSTTQLNSLELDGVAIPEFDSDTFIYMYELPFDANLPLVTATSKDNAAVFIRQALNRDGAAHITVVSEDAKTTQYYSVQFTQKPIELETVILSASSTNITEDDIVALSVKATMQDGTILQNELATITYAITSGSEYAKLQGGNLLAYDAGEVTVVAQMTYLGKTVSSDPLKFTIIENTTPKVVSSYDEYVVYTNLNVKPILPEKVRAEFEAGLPRDLSVTWDTIPADLYSKYGQFIVEGAVDNQILKPSVTVIVRDTAVAQQISMSTPVGMIPELPKTLTVYLTDGTQEDNVPVVWESVVEADFDKEDGTIVKINGSVAIDGITLLSVASVRVTVSPQSNNYVIMRNGYDLPLGIASYTNDSFSKLGSDDRAEFLNDGLKSFTMTGEKSVWTNFTADTQRTGDWISATIAHEGIRIERYVDKISVGFCQEDWIDALVDTPAQYFVEYYTGPIDYIFGERNNHVLIWADSPLNDDSNWKEVEYINKPDESTLSHTSMTDVAFKPVNTHMVRVRMVAKTGRCLGVNELEVYGRENAGYNSFDVTNIKIGSEDVTAQFDSNLNLTYEATQNDYPEITVSATKNSAVTINPAVGKDGIARIIITPEDGSEINRRVYTINFKSKTDVTYYPNVELSVDGNEVEYLSDASGKTLTASFKIKNDNSENQDISVYAALYNSNGNLEHFEVVDKTIIAHEESEISIDISVPENTSNMKYKMFVWDADTIIPLGDAIILN